MKAKLSYLKTVYQVRHFGKPLRKFPESFETMAEAVEAVENMINSRYWPTHNGKPIYAGYTIVEIITYSV